MFSKGQGYGVLIAFEVKMWGGEEAMGREGTGRQAISLPLQYQFQVFTEINAVLLYYIARNAWQ